MQSWNLKLFQFDSPAFLIFCVVGKAKIKFEQTYNFNKDFIPFTINSTPVSSVSPGNLLEMPILRPYHRPAESGTLEVGPQNLLAKEILVLLMYIKVRTANLYSFSLSVPLCGSIPIQVMLNPYNLLIVVYVII